MALDGIMLQAIINDLKNDLPTNINKIYNLNNREYLFNLYANKTAKKLIIGAIPNLNRLHYTKRNYQIDQHPNNFTMVLRKHLNNGKIIDIIQHKNDRYIKFVIENFNNIGDKVSYHLYLELLNRYTNIILCDENDIIIDAIVKKSIFDDEKNVVLPNIKYQIDYQDKQLLKIDASFDINQSLVSQFSGVSKTLENEIRYRLNTQNFNEIVNEILNSNTIYVSDNHEFHLIPLNHLSLPYKSYPIHLGFDEMFYQKSTFKTIEEVSSQISKFLNKQIKRLRKKLIVLNNELEKNQKSDKNLLFGDLLLTYQNQIKKGMSEITLLDYNTNENVLIKLDSHLSGIDNSQKYYKLHKKQKASIKHLEEQINISKQNLNYFILLKDQLEFADKNSALEIKEELIEKKFLKAKNKRNPSKKLPSYLKINYDNIIFKVGRNNLQNEFITFRDSSKNNFWFHIQNYHGSHVVVAANHLKEKHIIFAATLATYFSKAKNLDNVDVNYTQIKYLKKVNKQTGMVTLNKFDTVHLKVDYNLINPYI